MTALARGGAGVGRARLALPLRSRSSSLRVGVGILASLLAISVGLRLFGPDATDQDLGATLQPPHLGAHPLGTDQLGRDVLAWTAGGITTALIVSVAVVTISATVGVGIGLVAGYVGGRTDAVLMRLVELQLAIPPVMLFIAASAVLIQPSMLILILLLSAPMWVPFARVVRTVIQSEREGGYVAAARLAGASRTRLLRVYLLPSTVSVTVVLASAIGGYTLLAESALSFLGLGLKPPHISLGYLIAQGQTDLVSAWWVVTAPGVALVLLGLAYNLIGDGLRDEHALAGTPASERKDGGS